MTTDYSSAVKANEWWLNKVHPIRRSDERTNGISSCKIDLNDYSSHRICVWEDFFWQKERNCSERNFELTLGFFIATLILFVLVDPMTIACLHDVYWIQYVNNINIRTIRPRPNLVPMPNIFNAPRIQETRIHPILPPQDLPQYDSNCQSDSDLTEVDTSDLLPCDSENDKLNI
jgi:hypothetical protein